MAVGNCCGNVQTSRINTFGSNASGGIAEHWSISLMNTDHELVHHVQPFSLHVNISLEVNLRAL